LYDNVRTLSHPVCAKTDLRGANGGWPSLTLLGLVVKYSHRDTLHCIEVEKPLIE